jgi:hypothetical protein
MARTALAISAASPMRRCGSRPPRDLLLVDLLDLGDHVGADDAGADLEDLHVFGGQALRVERHRHAEAGLRHAVLRAVHRRRVAADGGDEDDAAAALLDHPVGRFLREEVRALEVGGEQFVEALLGGFEHVAALAGRDAGVVDEQVEPPEARAGVFDDRIAVRGRADVALEDLRAAFGGERLGGVAAAAIGGDDPCGCGRARARCRGRCRGWLR